MKIFVALFALVAIAHAQDLYTDLIKKEVATLLMADPVLTVDQCTTKCDALFDLVNADDETHTDQVCMKTCDCQITKNNCPPPPTTTTQAPATTKAPDATTQAPHHTHPPHPTHPPHHTHPPHPSHPPHPDHGK